MRYVKNLLYTKKLKLREKSTFANNQCLADKATTLSNEI